MRYLNNKKIGAPRKKRSSFHKIIFSLHLISAFIGSDKPIKSRLNDKIIEDIVHLVMGRCKKTESEVRGVITTKCADENKMLRQRNAKKRKLCSGASTSCAMELSAEESNASLATEVEEEEVEEEEVEEEEEDKENIPHC